MKTILLTSLLNYNNLYVEFKIEINNEFKIYKYKNNKKQTNKKKKWEF